MYEGLGDAYLTQASRLPVGAPGSEVWEQKKEAYVNAEKYLRSASQALSGFASSDARLFSRLAEACAGQAKMESLDLASATPDRRELLAAERDNLRRESEEAIQRAQEILINAKVPTTDSNYRQVMLTRGNIIFDREVGATNDQKAGFYRQALSLYKEAAALLPDDPRPLLYEGLCYERLTGIAPSPDERQREFALGEAALRDALKLNVASPDYNSSLPYRVLASLYARMNDYHSVLDSLKNAQQADLESAESAQLEGEIHSVERYLADQDKKR